ncbi:hypothetical protein ACSMEB_08105 [Stenotrophomonas maltophilia]
MDIREAARIFHDWCVGEGVLVDASGHHGSSAAEMNLISPSFEAGKLILRAKRIIGIGFNESTSELIAYTKLTAPAKKALSSVPSKLGTYKITYRQGNINSVGELPPTPFGGPPYRIHQAKPGGDYYTCGSSISVGNTVDSGTLGALVKDAAGVLYGLSNNHVSGSCSCADVGLPIVAPGILDVAPGSLHPFTVGLHHRSLPMLLGAPSTVSIKANTDAAIFSITAASLLTSMQGAAYDTPAKVGDLVPGMTVEKVGRTTGHTKGYVVSEMYGPIDVAYSAKQYGFTGAMFFEGVMVINGTTELFSDSGDSGSLITSVVAGERVAVGIVFAGAADSRAPGGKVTLALPLRPIINALGVTLVSGHNV